MQRSIIPVLVTIVFAHFGAVAAADGWTDFVADLVDGQKVVYVSTSGSDPGTVYTWRENPSGQDEIGGDPFEPSISVTPFATPAAALAALDNNAAGWVLLRRGDEWPPSVDLNITTQGPSSEGWLLIGAYTEHESNESARPVLGRLRSDTGGHLISRVAFVSLKVLGGDGNQAIRIVKNGSVLHIEDVEIPPARGFGMSLQHGSGTTPGLSDVRIRRCVVHGRWAAGDPGPPSEHCSGIYADMIDGLLIEECVFYNNGWNETGTGAWDQNHNVYIHQSCGPATFLRNISADASANGCQHRPGGLNENNLYLRNAVGFLMGGAETPWDGGQGGAGGEARRNVVIDGRDIGAQHAGWGINLANTNGLVVEENLVVHLDPANCVGPHGIEVRHNTADTVVANNIIYNWSGSTASSSFSVWLNCPAEPSSCSPFTRDMLFTNNDFFQPDAGRLVKHGPEDAGSPVEHAFEANRYYSPASSPCERGQAMAGDCCGTQHIQMTFNDWVNFIGEQGEQWLPNPASEYPDPTRDMLAYMQHLDPQYQPTIDPITDFMNEAIKQSKTNWREEFTADEVNCYMRAGFWPCEGDLNNDGVVDVLDLLIMLDAWGFNPGLRLI